MGAFADVPSRLPTRPVDAASDRDRGLWSVYRGGFAPVGGLLQMRGRPTRRRGRIVEFMGQARRHGAEGSELFSLLRVAFHVPQPVRRRAEDLPGDHRTGAQHQPEIVLR